MQYQLLECSWRCAPSLQNQINFIPKVTEQGSRGNLRDDKFDPVTAFDNESFPIEEEEPIEAMVGRCHSICYHRMIT